MGKRSPKAAKATKLGTKKGEEEVNKVEEVNEVEKEKEPKHASKHASKGAKATPEPHKGKNYSHCIYRSKCWSDCCGCYWMSLEQVISDNYHDSHLGIFFVLS